MDTTAVKLESKLRSRLYTLRQMEQVIPKVLLKKVSDGIFMSVLRYGLGIYCPIRVEESDPHHTNIEGIKVVFNNMLRLLCGSKRSEHTSVKSMLEKLGWLSINQLAAEVRLIEVWKAIHLSDYSLSHVFSKFESATLPTRSLQKNCLKNNLKSRIRENSFKYPSALLWNSAPMSVTMADNEKAARKAIRKFVKSLPL